MNARGSCAKTADLVRALEASVAGDVTIVERFPSLYRSTFPLEVLSVRMPDGMVRSLVFKDLSRTGPTDPAWQIKAPFLHDPMRELEVYREVLAPSGLSVPDCVAIVMQPDQGRYWLFLEKVEGDPLWQIGEMDLWRRAAEWLADMHTRFAGSTQALPSRLLIHDREYHQRWVDRAMSFTRLPRASNGNGSELDWLAACCQRAVDWLIEQPITFLHGEFYPSNLIIQRTAETIRVCPVDWEMAGRGPGVVDLAALASGAWDDTERETIVSAYLKALPAGLRPSPEALSEGLDRTRLLLAVQWLGWSPDWTPPPEHDHDWMATAMKLAETLEP
ncbi:MAG: aminoglycoside phosphotransferase family protein [Gammaproteobacteria bacterium]